MSSTCVLAETDWTARREAHEIRVRAWIEPHKARSLRGEKHPVYDFLFGYYPYRPVWLRRWHPGPEFVLAGDAASAYLRWPGYCRTENGIALEPHSFPAQRREFALWVRNLLQGMQTRPASFACFGLHEWAMVYRQSPDQLRHSDYPLRLSAAETALVVESAGVCCTHFDAFRFFTEPARPLNRHSLARSTTMQFEQRGCLHANMDLYKWAFKLAPFTPSNLVADCFAFARDIREIDMRASPYDLRSLGFEPIAVESAEGRAEYERHQRRFAALSDPLRTRLIAVCDWLSEAHQSSSIK